MTSPALSPPRTPTDGDQRVMLHGVSWEDFERLLAIRGDAAAPRMTYLEGELELMSPSRSREWIRSLLGRLVIAYAEEKDLRLNAVGSWTLRSARCLRGVEPDECYVLGGADGADLPRLAIAVVWSPGGLDRLEVYRGLGVPEVWIRREGVIEVHLLEGGSYERAAASRLLPGLDLELVARLLEMPDQTTAVKALRAALGG